MEQEKKGLSISVRSFVIAIAVLLALMIGTFVITLVVPSGNLIISGNDYSFQPVEGGIPFWKWLLSPILVLGAEGNTTVIAVLLFLLVIGGVFAALNESNLMNYMLDRIIVKFRDRRYALLAALTAFFMAMGAFVGSFEEVIPLVPICVALAIGLGWDKETGIGMSLIAVGCGFSTGVANPFTVGVAQKLAGLPMFSGMWFRLLSAVFIYALLLAFLRTHAKRIEQPVSSISLDGISASDPKMNRGLKAFGIILGLGLILVLSSTVLTFLQDYTMIIVVLMFLVAGIVASILCGMKGKELFKNFCSGMVGILPAVVMILMASSVRYTLEEANVLDTLLYYAVDRIGDMSNAKLILVIYVIALLLNFFVSSGSAEAILLIPLITPIAQMHGLSSQLCVLAFAYGDGFSNVLYPTNAALLIALGLIDMNYGRYVKYSWKFQGLNFVLTCGLLLLGLTLGY